MWIVVYKMEIPPAMQSSVQLKQNVSSFLSLSLLNIT